MKEVIMEEISQEEVQARGGLLGLLLGGYVTTLPRLEHQEARSGRSKKGNDYNIKESWKILFDVATDEKTYHVEVSSSVMLTVEQHLPRYKRGQYLILPVQNVFSEDYGKKITIFVDFQALPRLNINT